MAHEFALASICTILAGVEATMRVSMKYMSLSKLSQKEEVARVFCEMLSPTPSETLSFFRVSLITKMRIMIIGTIKELAVTV
jgi:hypothetical protein